MRKTDCPPRRTSAKRTPNAHAAALKESLQKFYPNYAAKKALLGKLDFDYLVDALIDANLQRDEAISRTEAQHEDGGAELPELIDAAGFVSRPIESPPELIKGILHTGSKLVLGGHSKSFKTWTLLNLSLCVSGGSPWLGFKTTPGKVLFINFEIQSYAWSKRIKAVADAIGIELKPGQILLWNLRGHAADFHLLIPKIIERARNEKFSLIVLDPIYKLYGRADENKASDVAALLNEIERLTTETGAAVAFAAHFAKGNASGKEAIDRISGSGVFARDPDSLLIFTAHQEEECFTVDPILRNFAPVKPFAVRWKFPLMERDNDIDPKKLKKACGRQPEHSNDDLLKLLPAHGLTNIEWEKKAKSENDMSRRTFFNVKKKLVNARLVLEKDKLWIRNKLKSVQ